MRSQFLATLNLLLAPALADITAVWQCGQLAAYADGGIYCRKNAQGACGGDLGDFPAKKKFPMTLLAISHDNNAAPMDISLAEQTGTHTYKLYNERLYLNGTPGAFEPMGFVADNSTLRAGATTWGFYGAYGMLLWSQTGDVHNVGTQAQVWVETGYPGVMRLYWNQTKVDEAVKGNGQISGSAYIFCHGDYDPVLTPVGG